MCMSECFCECERVLIFDVDDDDAAADSCFRANFAFIGARACSHTHKTCHLPWVYTAVDIADDDEDDDDYRSISQLGVYARVRACAAGKRRRPPNRTTS